MRTLLFLLSTSLLFLSCEKEIDMDIPQKEPKIVVNGFFNPDSTFKLHLSESSHILSSSMLSMIIGATVELYEESNAIAKLSDNGDGYYISNIKPQFGKQYSIKASYKSLKSVEAEDILPSPVKFTGLDTATVYQEGMEMKEIRLTIDDSPGVNYYNLKLYSYRPNYIYDPISNSFDTTLVFEERYFSSDDPVFEETGGTIGTVFSDELFNGKKYTLRIKVQKDYSEINDRKIHVLLNHLSKDHFLYLQSFQKYSYTEGDPFSQPVRVYSNIKYGFGIFGGYTSYRDSI